MDYKSFNDKKINQYSKEIKSKWGSNEVYREYLNWSRNMSAFEKKRIQNDFLEFFKEFGKLRGEDVGSNIVQAKVKEFQDFITANFYRCDNNMLLNLSKMYTFGSENSRFIDSIGGSGTASFVKEAIFIFISK